MFGVNPKDIQKVMKQLGMKQEEIPAERVIIEKADGRIIIENPSVSKILMQGQETFQISGKIREEKANGEAQDKEQLEQDIRTIMEKTSCSRKEAEKALKQAKGDLAEAILSLS